MMRASESIENEEKELDEADSEAESTDTDEDDPFATCECMETSRNRADKLPYSSLYEDCSKSKRHYFIPALPVTGSILKTERDTSGTHLFSPFLYTIKLQHGPFSWEIQRRYRDFAHLHNSLRLFRAAERVKYPVRRIQEKRRLKRIEKAITDAVDNVQDAIADNLPGGSGRRTSTEGAENPACETGTNSVASTPAPYGRLSIVSKPGSEAGLLNGAADGTDSRPKRRFSSKRQKEKAAAPAPAEIPKIELDEYYRHPPHVHYHVHGHGKTVDLTPVLSVSDDHMTSGHEKDKGKDVPDSSVVADSNGNAAEGPKAHNHRVGKYRCCQLPKFPIYPEAMLSSPEDIEDRTRCLERYLQCILHIQAYRNHKETIEFLNISRLSFVHNIGGKYQEGLIKKRPGGRRQFHGLKRFCIEHCSKWGKRWLIIKDTFIAYMNPDTEELRYVLLFDWSFDVRFGADQTEGIRHGLLISNLTRELLLKCDSHAKAEEWRNVIMAVAHDKGKIWLERHRFDAFAPPRDGGFAQWFVDGRTYMEHVANMMELAKEEIFISDWWLSPEIYLKRPVVQGLWRLDDILKRKASQGVNVYVLLYKEVEMALGISSLYTKRFLMKLHPRIKVLRHPDHYLTKAGGGVYLWAHHEKVVVIDQNIAFVGGIDLCYGRWDDNQHRLTDLGSVMFKTTASGPSHSLLQGMRSIAQSIPGVSVVEPATAVNIPGIEVPTSSSSSGDPVSSSAVGVDMIDAATRTGFVPALEALKEEKEDNGSVLTSPEKAQNGLQSEAKSSTKEEAEDLRKIGKLNFAQTPTRSQSDDRSLNQAPSTSSVKKRQGFKDVVKAIGKGRRRSTEESKSESEVIDGPCRERNGDGKGGATVTRQSSMPPTLRRLDMSEIVQHYRNKVKQTSPDPTVPAAPGESKEEVKRSGSATGGLRSIAAWKLKLRRRRESRERESDKDELLKEYEAIWKQIQAAEDHCDLMGAGKLWLGKDYVNFIFKDFTDLQLPFHDFIDRSAQPRMPWHDIASVVYGAAARDVARHFIQRWNATKVEKAKGVEKYPLLIPKSYENVEVPKVFRNISHKCNVQVLRSASLWSVDAKYCEDSIHQAYLYMIKNAEHYIYIENQFFVSMLHSPEVSNGICQALCDRIVRAYKFVESNLTHNIDLVAVLYRHGMVYRREQYSYTALFAVPGRANSA